MKLLPSVNRIVNGVKYMRYRLNIPAHAVENTDLLDKELEAVTKNNTIIIREKIKTESPEIVK